MHSDLKYIAHVYYEYRLSLQLSPNRTKQKSQQNRNMYAGVRCVMA